MGASHTGSDTSSRSLRSGTTPHQALTGLKNGPQQKEAPGAVPRVGSATSRFVWEEARVCGTGRSAQHSSPAVRRNGTRRYSSLPQAQFADALGKSDIVETASA